MGIFGKDRDEVASTAVVEAPHPALASLEAFRDAPLEQAAAAVLVWGFADAKPWTQIQSSDLTLRAQELFGPATGLKGSKLLMHMQDRQFGLVMVESIDVLARSLLVHVVEVGSSVGVNLTLTRRGRRALDSGTPERWMDVPVDPA